MATGLLKGFWTFLNTDIRELPWGELTKTGAESAKAALEAEKAFEAQAAKIQELAPLVKDIEPFLKMLDSPIVQLAGAGLPFVSIAVTLARVYLEHSKQEPTLTDSVVLVGQIAYLASLEEVLGTSNRVKAALGKTSLKHIVERQIRRLDTKNLTETQAKKAQVCFHDSDLAKDFNQALIEELQEINQALFDQLKTLTLTNESQELQEHVLEPTEIQRFVERVAWNTHRYFNQALAETADKVKPLAELYRMGGQQALEKSVSLEEYLRDYISPDSTVPALRDRWRVFDEAFTLKDIYVPPEAQLLDRNGDRLENHKPVDLETWAITLLNDEQKKDRVMFIQGGPGRGKSAFCRMFAEWVRQQEHPRWTPILIRLRDVRSLEKDFEETLRKAIDRDFTRSDDGWLTDRNTRFLFLLDGFDELLMEGRTSGGLEDFLDQIGKFQRSCWDNPEKGHRVLVTGRTLSLQSIERRMPDNLERTEILPMDDSLQEQWFDNWSKLVQVKPTDLREVLHDSRLPERLRELAREPLLLYLLAAMHRDGKLQLEMFAGADGAKAKVLIYEQAITWVLTKQRSDLLNRELTELDTDSLRRILAEAGLCVVQSGGKCTAVSAIETRLQTDTNVKSLLEEARNRIKDNPLRNALAAFYLQPGTNDGGSVEFIHKSFGEFLCAERIKEALEDWSKLGDRRRGGFLVSDETMNWEIYDLLGYGGLTPEIVEYLMALLADSRELDTKKWIHLFQRLNSFYESWCQGTFIDAPPENLPQKKMRLLKEQLPQQEKPLGLRHVDVFAGLNCLILLLELHRYAQVRDDLQNHIVFYPSGQIAEGEIYSSQLLQIIHYGDSIVSGAFTTTVGYFLSRANLFRARLSNADLRLADLSNAKLSWIILSRANLLKANLDRADLDRADLDRADLVNATLTNATLTNADLSDADLFNATLANADLSDANLTNANLTNADLFNATLANADLSDANLTNANLTNANLKDISWNKETNWKGVQGLETAYNVPENLKQQIGLS